MSLLDIILGKSKQTVNQTEEEKSKSITTVGATVVKTIEVGSSGTEIYSGYLQEEYLQELYGTDWMDKIDMMRRSDPNVKMVLNALKSPIKSANAFIKINDAETNPELAELQKKLIEQALFIDIEMSFTKLIGEVLTMVDFGYSLFDITHQVKDDSQLGTYNTIKSISYRSQRTIERWILDKGKLVSVSQMAEGDLGVSVYLDSRFLLHFSPEQEGDNFEGVSVLRPMYGNWMRKNQFLRYMAAGIEKYSIPTPILNVPRGAESSPEYKRAKEALNRYVSGQANYLILPEGWTLTFNNITFDSEKIRQTIDFENKEMVNAILASFLLLGQNGAGSLALSGTLSDFYSQTITYLSDHISEQFQRKIITPLIKMNFGDVPTFVELKFDSLEEKANAEWANILKSLVDSRIVSSDKELEEYVREKYKLPLKAVEEGALPSAGGAPVQVMNGAQVTSLVQIVQSVAAKTLPKDSAIKMIMVAFQVNEQQAIDLLGSSGGDFKLNPTLAPEVSAPNIAPVLAEKKKTKKVEQRPSKIPNIIRKDAEALREFSNNALKVFSRDYISAIVREKNKLKEVSKEKAPINANVPSIAFYKDTLRAMNSYSALKSFDTVGKQFKPVKKLSEYRLAVITLNRVQNTIDKMESAIKRFNEASDAYINSKSYNSEIVAEMKSAKAALSRQTDNAQTILDEYLPFETKQRVKSKAEIYVETQKNDVIKASDLQYQSSISYTDDDNLLQGDMFNSVDKIIDNNLSSVGSDIQVSGTVNDSIAEASKQYAEETGDSIVSWTFIAVDDEVTTQVCTELNGHTFADNDGDLKKYTPPLHWNCRSYLQVNTTSTKNNPEIDPPIKLSKEAQGEIKF